MSVSISLQFDSPANQMNDAGCFNRGEDITVTPTVTFTEGEDPSQYTLTYVVYGPDGLTVPTSVESVILNSADLRTLFTPQDIGIYITETTITYTVDGSTLVNEFTIETCNFVVIGYNECNSFTISNKSLNRSFNYTIEEVGATTTAPATLNSGESVDVTFDNISMYILQIEYTGGVEQYILNNYCILEQCIAAYIEDIVCEDLDRCNPCPDEVVLDQMLLLSYSYFNKVHKEYGYNNFYSGLSDSKLAEIQDIEQTMDKLKLLCKRRGCLGTSFSSGTKISSPYTTSLSGCTTCGD